MTIKPLTPNQVFGRSKIAVGDNGSLWVGVPAHDNTGQILIYSLTQWQTIEKRDKSNQPFGDAFAVSGKNAVVVHPNRPGAASGQSGKGRSPGLNDAALEFMEFQGTEWVSKGKVDTKASHFGDLGVAMDGDTAAVAHSGQEERYAKTAITLYNRNGPGRTFYPTDWGPTADPYRFSGFDFKDGILIGMWNDHAARGFLRIWDTRSDSDEPRVVDSAHTMIHTRVVNRSCIVCSSADKLVSLSVNGAGQWAERTVLTFDYIDAICAGGSKVAARVFKGDKRLLLVYDVSQDGGLVLKRGREDTQGLGRGTGFDIAGEVLYSGLPGAVEVFDAGSLPGAGVNSRGDIVFGGNAVQRFLTGEPLLLPALALLFVLVIAFVYYRHTKKSKN